MTAFFVTGTDTEVGKTTITTRLLSAARRRGATAIGFKPIETGCGTSATGPDAQALAEAAGHEPTCSYAYADPVGISVAAKREGRAVDIGVLRQHARELEVMAEILFVEGAGGLMVPLNASTTTLDLACALAYPVVLVAADKLGCQNHVLLTCATLEAAGLDIAHIFLNERRKSEGDGLSNREALAERGLPIHSVPHGPWSSDDDDELLSLLVPS